MDARIGVGVLGVLVLVVSLRSPKSVAQERCDLSAAEEVRTYTRVSDGATHALWPLLRQHEFYTLRAVAGYSHRAGERGIWSPFVGRRGGRFYLLSNGAFCKGNWAAFGGARYYAAQRDSVGGNLMAAPELFYPYLLADNSWRTERIESYGMYGGASYRHRQLLLGLGAQFDGTTHFSRRDPRVRGRSGDFSVNATVGVEWLGCVASATGAFRRFFEPLSVSIEREQSRERIYFLLGFGLFDHSLSKLVKTLDVHYLHTAWLARIDFHGVRAGLPWGYVSYERGAGRLITSELAEASRTNVESWRGALGWEGSWARWSFATTMRVEYGRHVGTEIFYRWYEVNASPKLYERREYKRVRLFKDARMNIEGCGRVTYVASRAALYVDALSGYTNYGSRYDEGLHSSGFSAVGYRVGVGSRFRAWRVAVDISLYGHGRVRMGEEANLGAVANRQEAFYAAWYDNVAAQTWGVGSVADFSVLLSGEHRLGLQVGGGWMRRWESREQGYMVGVSLWYSFGKERES